MDVQKILFIYLIASAVMSLIAIFLYSHDKKRALKAKRRIHEKILLFCAVFFGSVGSFIGRIIAHHKTNKLYFSLVIYFSLFVQIVTTIVLITLM